MIPAKPKMTQETQRLPGIRCPHCGNFIPTSIQQILFSGCLFCPTCGLKLNIDKRKSDKALKILAKVDEAQRRVEESSNFSRRNCTNGIEPEPVVDYSEEIEEALNEIVFIEEEQ